jgi:RNA polymerase sigma-70 factor, ECF subfamily
LLLNRLSALDDTTLVTELAAGNTAALDHLVHTYYGTLCRSAKKYVRSSQLAEEIVQDVFVSLWERRMVLAITGSLQAYLFTAVKYRCINCLRQMLSQPTLYNVAESFHPSSNVVDDLVASHELEHLIAKAVDALPPRCRIIFDLSRNAGLTYKEIAVELGISLKTVETQVTIALSRLKAYLAEHWGTLACLPILYSAAQ